MLSVDVTVRHAGGQAVVTLRGELDLASTPALAPHLTAAAACGPSVIVDLSRAAPPPQVRKILVVTGLIGVFAVHPSVDAAAGARAAHPLPGAARRPAARGARPAPLV